MQFATDLLERANSSVGLKGTPARLLLVDDDERVLDQMCHLLSGEFEIVGRARDGKQMIAEADRLLPDIIVADVSMPNLDGITAMRSVLDRHPGALVILFTMHREPDVVRLALEAGARGYVYKLQGIDDVIQAIHSVLCGDIFVSSKCLNEPGEWH